MRLMITGHRDQKLKLYDNVWIKGKLDELLTQINEEYGITVAYSGMASGVDLSFCESCQFVGVPFIACIPFDGQELTMDEEQGKFREDLLKLAKEVNYVKNCWMVEHSDAAIVVFDGNKGGTANVFQQLIEKRKNFFWINPVAQVVWKCFVNDVSA